MSMASPDISQSAQHRLIETDVNAARSEGMCALSETVGKRVLQSNGIAVPRSCFALAEESLDALARSLSPPFALKLVSADIIHKTNVGGVRLNIPKIEAACASLGEMRESLRAKGIRIDGWLLEEMAPPGLKIVIGGTRDRRFGPTIMVGLGGVFVELLDDVSFRVCPIDAFDARQMISELRGARLLNCWRGRPSVSLESLEKTLLKMGGENGLLIDLLELADEVEINPLILTSSTAIAVDARIILGGSR